MEPSPETFETQSNYVKPTVSFLISSAYKPYEQFGKKVIESIENIDCKGLEYEILYCSPRKYRPNEASTPGYCTFITDYADKGAIPAYNAMIPMCSGEYVCILADDHLVPPNFFDAIDFLKSDVFKDRKYKICTLASRDPCYLPPAAFGPLWQAGVWPDLKPWLIMRFPVVSMQTLKDHMESTIFYKSLFSHFGDCLAGYFLGSNDEPGLECSSVGLTCLEESNAVQNEHKVWDYLLKDNAPRHYSDSYLQSIKYLRIYEKGLPYNVGWNQ